MTTTTTVTASSGTYSLDTDNYTITMDSDSYITMGDTITVPANSLDGVSLDPVSFNTDFTKSPSSIRIGDIEITEEKFSKIEALIDIIEGMEGSDLLDMLKTQTALNRVKKDGTTESDQG